jgi:hypothetical protein
MKQCTKCVYVHKNPQTGEAFYVGSGRVSYKEDGSIIKWKSRPYDFYPGKNYHNRSKEWAEYVEENGKPIVEILIQGLTNEEALRYEADIANTIGLENLVNKKSGEERDGTWRSEHSIKIKESGHKPPTMVGVTHPMYGKRRPEHADKIRQMWNEGKYNNRPIRRGYKMKLITCPHCGKQGGNGIMKRWHFDNCKEYIVK